MLISHMAQYLLLQIEDVFQLPGGRLVVVPDFPPVELPKQNKFSAILRTPESAERACTVTLQLTHFNISGNAEIQERWRIVPMIDGLEKHEIPVESKLIISNQDVARALELRPIDNNGVRAEPGRDG